MLPQGLIATNDLNSLPLPVSGYRVYLVGETHGNRETKDVFMGYVRRLYRQASLRDVILEEDQAYEEEAQAFVAGRRDHLPEGLCLRADILERLRAFNRDLPSDLKIRVHLVDIDSPETTIRRHLVRLINKIGTPAEDITVPEERLSHARTGPIIEKLSQLTTDRDILSELQTVKQSLILFDSGLRIHTGAFEGNPLAPVREETITANILDVLNSTQSELALGLYGAVHVQKVPRASADLRRDIPQFTPLSERLEVFGIRVYRMICYPLAGNGLWRQRSFELPSAPAAADLRMSGGETVQDVLERAPDSVLFYFDPAIAGPLHIEFQAAGKVNTNENGIESRYEKLMEDFRMSIKPTFLGTRTDTLREQFDSYIFLREATPMEDRCTSMEE